MQRKALNERYARRLEREWAERYILPYVREAYAEDVRALSAWYREDGAPALAAFHEPGCCSFCRLLAALAMPA